MTLVTHCGDCLDVMRDMPERSVDLVFGSPPYCDCRTYGIDAQRKVSDWVEWMLEVTEAAQRVSRGPVIWVAWGPTRKRSYQPACEGLMWEWFKRGGDHQLYRPCVFHRVGIPGSGGTDWLRADWEYVMCFKRPGELIWSDNTAMGHPPKCAPGGEMSHRLTDGERVNQWGGKPSSTGMRRASGARRSGTSPSHVVTIKRFAAAKRPHTKRRADGQMEEQAYHAPVLANPGNVIHCKVGGGHLGSKLAHENEAPFPESLAEFFVRSFCPPDGTVLDPFSGSGTVAAVAEKFGRHSVAIEIRESQIKLTRRRFAEVERGLFREENE